MQEPKDTKEPSRRHAQIANAIRQELVDIARREISDPRLERVGMITFSGVDLSPDGRDASVWVSFMGKEEKSQDVQDALKALSSASGFIHRLLIKRLPMKVHPRLNFKFDKMFDRAAVIHKALNEAAEVEKETIRVRGDTPATPEEPDGEQ